MNETFQFDDGELDEMTQQEFSGLLQQVLNRLQLNGDSLSELSSNVSTIAAKQATVITHQDRFDGRLARLEESVHKIELRDAARDVSCPVAERAVDTIARMLKELSDRIQQVEHWQADYDAGKKAITASKSNLQWWFMAGIGLGQAWVVWWVSTKH